MREMKYKFCMDMERKDGKQHFWAHAWTSIIDWNCYENYSKKVTTNYLLADFGAYSLDGSMDLNQFRGVVILAKTVNGIRQKMPTYNFVSGMTRDEMEERCRNKENYKSGLTPEELVEEIRKSSDRVFCFNPEDPNMSREFPGQVIDAELLEPEFKLITDFYEFIR